MYIGFPCGFSLFVGQLVGLVKEPWALFMEPRTTMVELWEHYIIKNDVIVGARSSIQIAQKVWILTMWIYKGVEVEHGGKYLITDH